MNCSVGEVSYSKNKKRRKKKMKKKLLFLVAVLAFMVAMPIASAEVLEAKDVTTLV